MADLRPADVRDILEMQARNYGQFQDIRPDVFPDEIPTGDMPTWALDPRERELDHTSTSTNNVHYEVDVEFILYIAVESGPEGSDRSAARAELETHRHGYLEQLLQNTRAIEKTGRLQGDLSQLEVELMMDAITVQANQVQIYK